jgi:hypothetical protein
METVTHVKGQTDKPKRISRKKLEETIAAQAKELARMHERVAAGVGREALERAFEVAELRTLRCHSAKPMDAAAIVGMFRKLTIAEVPNIIPTAAETGQAIIDALHHAHMPGRGF